MASSISCRPFVREGRTSRNTGSVNKESRHFVNPLYFVDHLAFLCGLPPERESETDRQTGNQTDRQTDRQSDRQTQIQRQRETETNRERDRDRNRW